MGKTKESLNDGVNYNILNIITPSGVDIRKNSIMIGENFAKFYVVTNFPANPEFGWLAKITQIEGTTAKVEFEPTDSSGLIERCNEQISQYRIGLNEIREESVRQAKEKAIEDISNMIKRINEENEIVGYANVILLIQASNEQKLEDRIKKVNSILSSFGGKMRNLVFQQELAYKSVAPYGIPEQKIGDIGQRNMPLSTFMGGYINSFSGFNDGTGFLIGRSKQGKPIILNTNLRGGDRTNGNWFITGKPGVGKSATVKFITLMEYAFGKKIIFLDPEREYVEMVKNLGGKVINCGGGKGGKINPLQVRKSPKVTEEECLDKEDKKEDYTDEGHGMGDLALHIQDLRTFIYIYLNEITTLEMAKVEEILECTYRRFDITWDTDCEKLKPQDFPIFSDFYEEILKECKQYPDDEILKNLKSYFRSIAVGADSAIFNGHTDIKFDTDVMDLDISALLDGDERILKAQFHNINSFIWKIVTADRTEEYLYVIDEGYLIVDPDNPGALKFVKNFAKRCRKYEASLMFITHSVVDVLDPSVKRHGQALVDLATYKFIMGCDGKNLEDTVSLFKLTEQEENLLNAQQQGKGLLFAGASRIEVKIDIPQMFLNLMGKAGGR